MKKKLLKTVLLSLSLGLLFCVPGKISAKEANTNDIYYLYDGSHPAYNGQTTLAITEDVNEDLNTFLLEVPEMKHVTKIVLSDHACTVPFDISKKCPNVKEIHISKDINYSPFVYGLRVFKKLSSITVDPDNKTFAAKDNVLYTYDMKQIVAYPHAKKDTVYKMPSTVTKDFDTLNTNPYLKQVTISKNYNDLSSFQYMDGCLPNLKSIGVATGNKYLKASNGVLYSYNKKTVILYPNGKTDTAYTVPNTVTELSGCFGINKYLKTLTLGKEVSTFEITDNSYVVLPNLKNIKAASGNTHFISYNGALYTPKYKELIYCPRGKTTPYTVHTRTKTIGSYAFENSKLKKITLPKGLQKIEFYAFHKSSLTSLTLPAGIVKLENFSGNMNYLKKITVKSGCKLFYSKDGILYNKNGSILVWPKKLHVKSLSFTSDTIKQIDLSQPNVKYVDTLYIGKNVKKINVLTQNLKKIVLNKKNKSFHLYNGVLYNADYSKIVLYPNDNPDTSIKLHKNLKELNYLYFSDTNKTEELTLPEGLEKIITCYTLTNQYKAAGSEQEYTYGEETGWISNFMKSHFQNLKKINISVNNGFFTTQDNVLYSKDMTQLVWYPINKADRKYILPDTVTKLNAQLREFKNLRQIILNTDVKSTLDYLGLYSDSLRSIVVPINNVTYASRNGVLYSKAMDKLIVYPNGKTNTSYTMPESVTEARFTLSNKHLQKINLSSNLNTVTRYPYFSYQLLQKNISAGGFFGFENLQTLNGLNENIKFIYNIYV